MNYIGNTCDGCFKAFGSDDDIVVCPECGTPQHRECYEKNNCCVNSDKHEQGFVWRPTVENREAPAVTVENISCPNCGALNPKGSTACRNCNMKFTLFGMNVVDAMHEEEKKSMNQNGNIPSYDSPFTLGEGEGFENTDKNNSSTEQASPEQVLSQLTDILSGQSQSGDDGRIDLGGPFPHDDEIDGVRTNNIGNFIGQNAMKYISKFKKIKSGKKTSFNFAAFFFGPYWFFYRRLYKLGIIFLTVFISLSILALPFSLEVSEFANQIVSVIGTSTAELTDAQMSQIMDISSQMFESLLPLYLIMLIQVVISLVLGFRANHIYKKYVIENTRAVETMRDRNSAMAYIIKNGGTAFFIAVAAFFVNRIIAYVISFII